MGLGASAFEGLSVDQGVRAISEHLHARNMKVEEAFSWVDRDHNGWVSWEEFFAAVNHCCSAVHGKAAHHDSVFAIFGRFDQDANGFISLQEFTQVISRGSHLEKLAEEVVVRIATALVRTGYTPQELFSRLDKDQNGVLSRLEVEDIILGLQPDLTPSEREAIFRRLDRDTSGSVDLLEFRSALEAVSAAPLVALETKIVNMQRVFTDSGYGQYESFHAFDSNKDGYLSREEWQAAMAALLPNMNAVDADSVFQRFDVNGDGFLTLQEFSKFFQDSSDRAAHLKPGIWPTYQPPPVEAPWEKDVLDLVRDCLSVGRTGMSIAEVFRRLDVDHDSKMTAYEFDRMVTAYRSDLQQEHLSALFQKVNTSRSGAINLIEFTARFGH